MECENDSFPLLSSNAGQQRDHPECCSFSDSLSNHLSPCVSVPLRFSVHLELSVSAALLYVFCTVTLTKVSLFFLPCPLHCPQEMQHSTLCRQQQ